MNGNGQEGRDGHIGGSDVVDDAIAEKLEHGHAEEERFGFPAVVANATPPVDETFRRTLRASLKAEAAQTEKEKRQMSMIQDRRREVDAGRLYSTLRLAFTLSVTAALLAFVFASPWGRTVAQSAWRFFVRTERAAGLGGHAGPQLVSEDIDALADRLNEEPDPRTVAVFPADYAPALAEHIQHEVVPLAIGDELAPAAVQAAVGAALPQSGLVDVVLFDQAGGDVAKQVRASLERQLYRLYRGPGDAGAETFGAVEMKQYVAGYVAGIGLVEEDPKLRVLAEPVTLTRGDFTIEVDHALLYADRTVVHYRVESVDTYPFAEPGDETCLEYAHLRLPDGSTLEPQSMGDGRASETGYEFATSFADPIPSDVTKATLVIPCLLESIRGAAPENWELTLRFIAAPRDMDLAAVYDADEGQTATDQGVTVDLAYVVAEEDGYIFNFGLMWDRDGEQEPELYPGSLHVTDATGQEILLSSAGGRPPMANQASESFTFRTSEMPAPGPLTLKLEAIRAAFSVHDVSFTFDPGSDPQPDQVWTLDEHFSVAGYEWDITSARMVAQDGGSTAGEVEGFEFTTQAADPGMMVELLDTAHPLAVSEPGLVEGTMFSSTLTYENGIPDGPITVTVSQVSVLIPGDWQIRWEPPAEQVAGLQPIDVTFDNGVELVEAGVLDTPRPGEPLRIALEWRTENPVDDPVTVFAHLMCEAQLVAQRDAIPGNGEFPAPSWQPRELIRDQFALQLPAELPEGACQVQVGIYNPDSGQRYSPLGLEGPPYVVIQRFSVENADEAL